MGAQYLVNIGFKSETYLAPQEATRARDWVATKLQLGDARVVNVFETTIRVLGGLLSAFHLFEGDRSLLFKATELTLRMLAAFDTTSKLPNSDINLYTLESALPSWTDSFSLSEVATLSLEFSYAAQVRLNSNFLFKIQ